MEREVATEGVGAAGDQLLPGQPRDRPRGGVLGASFHIVSRSAKAESLGRVGQGVDIGLPLGEEERDMGRGDFLSRGPAPRVKTQSAN